MKRSDLLHYPECPECKTAQRSGTKGFTVNVDIRNIDIFKKLIDLLKEIVNSPDVPQGLKNKIYADIEEFVNEERG